MKTDHLVPLSRQAVTILRDLRLMTGHGKFVLPGIRTDERCMSENTFNAALRSMGYPKDVMTAHGFRAMARNTEAMMPFDRGGAIRRRVNWRYRPTLSGRPSSSPRRWPSAMPEANTRAAGPYSRASRAAMTHCGTSLPR